MLEIGSGTGQATVPLAERGLRVTAIEPGPNLAALARRKLARFPDTTIVLAAFETWPLPPEPFDAVVAATAFHWLDPAIRVSKIARALRPGGALATIATNHIEGGDRQFFVDVQDCYEEWLPGSADQRVPAAVEVGSDAGELEDSGRFERPAIRRYEWERSYSAQEYVDLLDTYSDHRALDEAARGHLFDCIVRLIEQRFGGRIRKRYLNTLVVARRR